MIYTHPDLRVRQRTADGGYFAALRVMTSKEEVIKRLKKLNPDCWAFYVKGYETPEDFHRGRLCSYYEFDGVKLEQMG